VEYRDWSALLPEGVASLATTSVVSGRHVYFYPLCVPSPAAPAVLGNILVRVPTDRLDDPGQAVEYYASDGSWQKGLVPAKARIVLEASVSELSVRYHPDRGQWLAVYLDLRGRGDRLLGRWAERLEGPWSAPQVLLPAIPEVTPADPRYHRATFCYAGKEHIQFASPGRLVATYVCNASTDGEEGESFLRGTCSSTARWERGRLLRSREVRASPVRPRPPYKAVSLWPGSQLPGEFSHPSALAH
jgi:hypothetical protein